jgi:hypothetical protein
MLDVACRRIAWDAAAIWAWCSDRVGLLLGSLRPREVEAEATLAALKLRLKQADASSAQSMKQAETDPLVSTPSKKRKFEASQDFQAQDDFTQAVGGADQDMSSSSTPSGPTLSTDQPQEQGLTTSRLLEAKRRARENRDGNE